MLIPLQFLLIGPPLAPVWIAGLVALLRHRDVRPWRPLGTAYLVLLAILFVLGGKGYYAAPLLLCLLAPGAIVVERWSAGRSLRRTLLVVAVLVTAATSAVIALPLVPVAHLADTPIPDLNEEAGETVGWPELVRSVARVRDALPPAERDRAVVFTENYGEAGAVDRYGPALGVPHAYSGHNAYWRFGKPPDGAAPVIVLGYEGVPPNFVGCGRAASVDNGVGVENEEQGGAVWLCAGPQLPWSRLWPRLRHLDA
jgi:hypothetical protein